MEQIASCIQCGECVRVCVGREVITLTEQGPEFNLEKCIRCGHCMAVCPTDAIEHPLSPRQELAGPVPGYEEAARYMRGVRSIRLFKDSPVEREKLMKMLEMGRYPQTGGNSQGISYLVVDGREKVCRLMDIFCQVTDRYAAGDPTLEGAAKCVERYRRTGYDVVFRGCPQLVLALSDASHAGGRANAQFSLTFMALIAPTLGIGTCWAGYLERLACDPVYQQPFLDALDVPEGKVIRGALMVGVPDVPYRRLVARDALDVTFR